MIAGIINKKLKRIFCRPKKAKYVNTYKSELMLREALQAKRTKEDKK